MKKFILLILISSFGLNAQKSIKLPFEKAKGLIWEKNEIVYKSDIIRVANISEPSIQIYQPKKKDNTGTTVIILPGGGMTTSSITTEGTMVADYLVKKGITAVVLKYRLRPTKRGRDLAEFKKLNRINKEQRKNIHKNLFPAAISDALIAVEYIREHANDLNIKPNKIGVMGFSAGGAVTMGVGYNYTSKNRPDFLAPIYPWITEYPVQTPKTDAPPLFVVCASNDPLKLAVKSIDLYKSYKQANKNAELHMYAKGKHGFGMVKQNLPSDTWIDRFYDWAIHEKLVIALK